MASNFGHSFYIAPVSSFSCMTEYLGWGGVWLTRSTRELSLKHFELSWSLDPTLHKNSPFPSHVSHRLTTLCAASRFFNVNQLTGQVTVAAPPGCVRPGSPNCLDYETQKEFKLTFVVGDQSGEGFVVNVPLTIHVLDQNDNSPKLGLAKYFRYIKEGETTPTPHLQVQVRGWGGVCLWDHSLGYPGSMRWQPSAWGLNALPVMSPRWIYSRIDRYTDWFQANYLINTKIKIYFYTILYYTILY